MNVRFLVRGSLLALTLALLICAVWVFLQTPYSRRPDPTPPAPTILAPNGVMPTGPVGLQEWAKYHGQPYQLVGCGFVFLLPQGTIVGATTAHSVAIGQPDRPLERIALGVAGESSFVAESDTLWGLPGRRTTYDGLASDHLLLQVIAPAEVDTVLGPDPRGAPQPGERVSLYSGLGDGRGGPRILAGTVQSVDGGAVWVLMDHRFNPSRMSGSPLVSQHTGQVVAMVVAASPRLGRLLIGASPIASLIQSAESATSFPTLAELQRPTD